jgi:hypothetical protein
VEVGNVVMGRRFGLAGGKHAGAVKVCRAECLPGLFRIDTFTVGELQCAAPVSGDELPSGWISRPDGE